MTNEDFLAGLAKLFPRQPREIKTIANGKIARKRRPGRPRSQPRTAGIDMDAAAANAGIYFTTMYRWTYCRKPPKPAVTWMRGALERYHLAAENRQLRERAARG